jgi:predicted ATPase/transcriptional regulator with XRE-family HTH domain
VIAGGDGSFGELLRGLRAMAGLTQDELAERSGVSVRGLRYLEQGSRRPYPDTIRRVADALDASAADREALAVAARRPALPGAAAAGRRRGRVPAPLSPLIGREVELAVLDRLLGRDDVRVVTITGPGGVGKTRLAIEAATRMHDGVWEPVWVPLATLLDPAMVPAAIGQALGVVRGGAVSDEEAVSNAVGDRPVVLVVDNVEHLLAAAGFLAELLSRCPALKVLATSRAALRLGGEHEFPLAPFPVPRSEQMQSVHAIATNPAVDLFLRRAQAIRPRFTLTGANVGQVAAICRHLDGLPLAIELAAARIRVLSPQAMLDRLQQQRFRFLTSGAAGSPARQATLGATLDWSHDLLDPVGQVVFRRLAVFHGGCTLAAAEAVTGGHGHTPDDVLEAVENLQRNSLLTVSEPYPDDGDGGRDGQQPRLRMLDTIREYGVDKLHGSGEYRALTHAHAQHFVHMAEQCARDFYTPRAAAAINRLADDVDNLRIALRRSVRTGDTDLALRLVAALWTFWYVRGHLGEGRAGITAVLQSTPAPPAGRPLAQALLGAGQLALAQGDYTHARAFITRSIGMHRGLGDAHGTAEALLAAGFAARLNDQPDTARATLDEARSLATAAGHQFVVGAALHHLGLLATARGDHAEARRLLADSLTCYRQLQLHRFIALVTLSLGELALATGDTRAARDQFGASLDDMLDMHAVLDLPAAFGSHADLAAATGDLTRAVRLAAAAAHQHTVTGSRPWPDTQRRRDQWLAAARTRLGGAAFTAAWADGQRMSIEEAAVDSLHNAT